MNHCASIPETNTICKSTIFQIYTHSQRHTALMVLTLNPCLIKDSPDPGVIRGPSSSSASSSDWSSSFFFFFFVGSLGFFNRESSSGCLMSVTIKKKKHYFTGIMESLNILHLVNLWIHFKPRTCNFLLCMFVFWTFCNSGLLAPRDTTYLTSVAFPLSQELSILSVMISHFQTSPHLISWLPRWCSGK